MSNRVCDQELPPLSLAIWYQELPPSLVMFSMSMWHVQVEQTDQASSF